MTSALTAEQLTGFEILDGPLLQDTFRQVYKARQLDPDRLVALEIVRPTIDDATRDRLRDAAEHAVRLSHASIMQLHEVGDREGRLYLVREFVEAPTLDAHLANQPMRPREAAELVALLARAVEFAHQRGVVHGGLSAQKVLLAPWAEAPVEPSRSSPARPSIPGLPKIADFGLCLTMLAGPRIEASAVQGWEAPELLGNSRELVGPATDVYGLGVIFYQALTGQRLFAGREGDQLVEAIVSTRPTPLNRIQSGVPRDLQTICHKCLEKDWRKRYRSAGSLERDLGRYLAGRPIRAQRSSASSWLARRMRGRSWRSVLLGLFVVAMVVMGTIVATQLVRLQGNAERTERNYRAARDAVSRMLGPLALPTLSEAAPATETQVRQMQEALGFYEIVAEDREENNGAVRLDIARAHFRAGQLLTALGHPGGDAINVDLLTRGRNHFLRALDLYDALAAHIQEGVPDPRMEAALCRTHIGYLYAGVNEPQVGEQYYREALATYELLARERPDGGNLAVNLAWCHHGLGAAALAANRTDDAEASFRKASEAWQEAVRRGQDGARVERLDAARTLVSLVQIYAGSRRPEKARQSLADAEVLLRPLERDAAFKNKSAVMLAAGNVGLAEYALGENDGAKVLELCGRGLDLLTPVLREEPQLLDAQRRAFDLYLTRAQGQQVLGHPREALADWDRVVQLATPARRDGLRVSRAAAMVLANDPTRAVSEANELANSDQLADRDRYNLACLYARMAKAVGGDSLAERAVGVLKRLKDAGFFEDVTHANYLRRDPDLEPLRGRNDFRRLLQGL